MIVHSKIRKQVPDTLTSRCWLLMIRCIRDIFGVGFIKIEKVQKNRRGRVW